MTRRPITKKYDADSIDVVQNVEYVRLRPEMFIPSRDIVGAMSLLKEAWANSVDEWIAGHCKRLRIKLSGPLSFEVEDDGRGIPVDMHKKTGQPALTSIFTLVGSGGKFRDDSYGGVSAGLHGVGITAVNALSASCEVWTRREGKVYYQAFKQGVPVAKLKRTNRCPVKLRHGTMIRVTLDASIFEKTAFKLSAVRSICKNIGVLCPGLKIFFEDAEGHPEDFTTKAGIQSLLGEEPFNVGPIVIQDTKGITAALGWRFSATGTGEDWQSFVNVNPTADHGMHVRGAQDGLTAAMMGKARGSGLSGPDLRDGLVVAIHAMVPHPQFQGQAKTRLAGSEPYYQARDVFQAACTTWFKKHGKLLRLLIDRAKQLRLQRAEYKKALATLRKVEKGGRRGNLPTKLAMARCDPGRRELYLVEGQSAGGTAIKARNDGYQEILPLRGKVINAARAPLSKVLDNEEIQDILRSVGGGFGKDFDVSKMRVGKILVMADGDADGCHITCLLTAFFLRYLTPLVKAGKLYVVLSPLYLAEKGMQRWFGDTLAEVKKKAASGSVISRLKGHGSANVEDLRWYAMGEHRKLLRVSAKGTDEALRLLGNDASVRKELLDV